ncbi:MAG TPA: MotA/TolQ/ExbB proton channel family protein [Patescibacteria group bacterium]|nr:MotA/TolQ/ExbB proton channel family protein [Patescibacteria group bacterium]
MSPSADSFGLAHFLAQGSPIELAPLYLLALMSIATWCVIVLKTIQAIRVRRQGGAFLRQCWNGGGKAQIEQYLGRHAAADPWSRLTATGLAACGQLAGLPVDAPLSLGAPDQFLTRVLRRGIGCEILELESGLTVLAIVASAAPFVGLFGTVWGIYHALIAIGTSGQSSLAQVAGPVGEALVMTAFGLGTALPAVLAYNIFVRSNRRILADLDGFAHDLFVFLGCSLDARGV